MTERIPINSLLGYAVAKIPLGQQWAIKQLDATIARLGLAEETK